MKTRFAAIIPVFALAAVATAQTAFTYQGRVKDGAQIASGPYDLRFSLFDAASGGAQLGTTQCVNDVAVVDGVFTTTIDFGQQFATPNPRFLEIEARADTGLACGDGTGFVVLTPRQLLTAAPLANHARSAFSLAAADGSPANAVTVDNNGRLGIGTSLINRSLSINGDPAQPEWISFQAFGPTYWYINGLANGWNLGQGTSPAPTDGRLFVSQAGNVGVGTTSPGGKLDVRGIVKIGNSGELFASGGVENLRIVRGTIASNGGIFLGTGFTCVRTAVGTYNITFSVPFASDPSITVTADALPGDGPFIASPDNAFAATCTVHVQRTINGAFADRAFHFTAVGPR